MTAPFIPPPIDSSAPTVGTTSSLSSLPIPSLAEATGPVAHTAPVVPGEPRPVVPAEEIGVPPAKALDPVAGTGLLEKAREVTMPYLQKIQETTKPYVDAAEHRAEELFEKLEHRLDGTSATTPGTGLKSTTTEVSSTGTVGIAPAPYAAGPGTGAASTSVGQSSGDLGEKAKQLFGQGLATVSGAFNQITTTLDEKTKTDTHPGIVSQATAAFQTGVHKVDDFLNDKTTAPATTVSQGPILTTTNTVPHIDPQGQQEVGKLL